jgi:hypothetical protein
VTLYGADPQLAAKTNPPTPDIVPTIDGTASILPITLQSRRFALASIPSQRAAVVSGKFPATPSYPVMDVVLKQFPTASPSVNNAGLVLFGINLFNHTLSDGYPAELGTASWATEGRPCTFPILAMPTPLECGSAKLLDQIEITIGDQGAVNRYLDFERSHTQSPEERARMRAAYVEILDDLTHKSEKAPVLQSPSGSGVNPK